MSGENRTSLATGDIPWWSGSPIQFRSESPVLLRRGDPVYFGRGPFEFVGYFERYEGERAVCLGIETGCLQKHPFVARIGYVQGLQKLTATELSERLQNESVEW